MKPVSEYSGTSNYVIYKPGNKECPSKQVLSKK